MPTPSSVLIGRVCEEIKELLLQKNQAYGDSALHPVRIFSQADPIEQINVRIDDKLSRLARGSAAGEDTELDLIGYLILKRVARLRETPDPTPAWVTASLGGYIPEDP
jgi:hypothetical protein